MKSFRPVAILGGQRTPFVKSFAQYQRITNQDLLTACLQSLSQKFGLKGERMGDVALGAVVTHPSDASLTRESILGTDLHPDTPGFNVQRACGTGLDTTWLIALKIAAGQIESGISGGADTNSDAPITFRREFAWKLIEARNQKNLGGRLASFLKFRPHDLAPHILAVKEARTGLSMGEHCEKMVKEWQISRAAQDQLAFESHHKAAQAWQEGFFDDLVFEFRGLKKDPITRADTSLEKLGKLKPAFDFSGQGTLTAGNSTPLSDGASVVLLGSEDYARQKNLPVLARFVDAETAAVDYVNGEGLLMAPTVAVPRLLARNGLKLQDFDFYEIHEAFAGQVLCTLKAWESDEYCRRRLGLPGALGSIDRSKMNVKGGSLAVGHPFAATGGRIVASLAKILKQKGRGRGLISVCTAGGMGVAAILEA